MCTLGKACAVGEFCEKSSCRGGIVSWLFHCYVPDHGSHEMQVNCLAQGRRKSENYLA